MPTSAMLKNIAGKPSLKAQLQKKVTTYEAILQKLDLFHSERTNVPQKDEISLALLKLVEDWNAKHGADADQAAKARAKGLEWLVEEIVRWRDVELPTVSEKWFLAELDKEDVGKIDPATFIRDSGPGGVALGYHAKLVSGPYFENVVRATRDAVVASGNLDITRDEKLLANKAFMIGLWQTFLKSLKTVKAPTLLVQAAAKGPDFILKKTNRHQLAFIVLNNILTLRLMAPAMIQKVLLGDGKLKTSQTLITIGAMLQRCANASGFDSEKGGVKEQKEIVGKTELEVIEYMFRIYKQGGGTTLNFEKVQLERAGIDLQEDA